MIVLWTCRLPCITSIFSPKSCCCRWDMMEWKAKFIFTPFSWHHLLYSYVYRYQKVFPSIDSFSVQTDLFVGWYKICNNIIVLTPLPKWRTSAVTSWRDYLKQLIRDFFMKSPQSPMKWVETRRGGPSDRWELEVIDMQGLNEFLMNILLLLWWALKVLPVIIISAKVIK